MTYEEIYATIAKQMKGIAEEVSEDYTFIICPERIFVEDYQQQKIEAMESNHAILEDEPNDTFFSHTIFIVIKLGGGQRNMAVSNNDITIQVLSEENDFEIARQILNEFVGQYNFQYKDGLAQAYFNPEMSTSMDAVYTGFRALLSIRGFIRIPQDGFIFITKMDISFDDDDGNEINYRIPFINLHYNYSAQVDPQAFAGFKGRTMALARQSTQVVQFATYLIYKEGDEAFADANAFSLAIMRSSNHMNKKYRITMKTQNGITMTGPEDNYFILNAFDYAQELADMSACNLSFAMAKSVED